RYWPTPGWVELELQCGRDRSVPETAPSPPRLSAPAAGFNEAVTVRSRKPTTIHTITDEHISFNEAVTVRSRKLHLAEHLRHERRRFNEAVTVRSRKPGISGNVREIPSASMRP